MDRKLGSEPVWLSSACEGSLLLGYQQSSTVLTTLTDRRSLTDTHEASFSAVGKPEHLPASLTRVRCIGALIERKFFCDKALSRSRGSPRCRHSVTRTCLRLHLLKDARLLHPLTAVPPPATPVPCCWGRRTGC